MCILHKGRARAVDSRRRPLFHYTTLLQKSQVKFCTKKHKKFFPELCILLKPSHHLRTVSACVTLICPHMPLKARAWPAGYGSAGSKTGNVERPRLFMRATSICDTIWLKPESPHLTLYKKYDIILKKDFFMGHLTFIKKYDIIIMKNKVRIN